MIQQIKKTCSTLILSLFFVYSWAQTVPLSTTLTKRTLTYAIKEKDTLKMDILRSSKYGHAIQPCLVFVFGGAFAGGTRDGAGYNPYFNRMTDEGFTIISIDYRLLRKGASNGGISGGGGSNGGASGNTASANINSNKISLSANSNALAGLIPTIPIPTIPDPFNTELTQYKNAINAAVEDLFTATLYILNNQANLQVDPDMIILSGSSAGAITCLHANWALSNRSRTSATLPQNFTYKGTIGFSGAILAGSSGISYGTAPSPTLFIHGTKDTVVPYGTNNYVVVKLMGSSSIVNVFKNKKYPYYFLTVNGANHDLSVRAMTTEQDRILNFIQKYIIEKQPLQIDETI